MVNRICSIVAVATLLSLSSGCCGMKNFLFGRGARCGLCNKLPSIPRPQFGNVMQAPCGQTPYTAQPQTPQYAAPAYQAPQTGCGCNQYADQGHISGETCGSCYGSAYSGNCGCGNGAVVDGYAPMASDPYLNGGVVNGEIIQNGGQIYGEQIIGGSMYNNVVPNGVPVQSDSFNARKVDTDGNKILWEQPLPPGAKPL
ncbi:MAG: hypothetical protein AB8B91_09205 [Rubripirellula sp.]